jgi:hypothetical protein
VTRRRWKEVARGEDTGDRIVHDLIAAAGGSRRIGPDRARLIELAEGRAVAA